MRLERANSRGHRQGAPTGVEPSRLPALILTQPEIKANGQHDQVRKNPWDEENAGGNLLIEKRDSIKGCRRKTQDEPEHTDQH